MHRSDGTNLEQLHTPRAFLDEVYRSLHYEDGTLLDAVHLPDDYSRSEWVDKGDWLSLAAEIGAEKVFFVNNDPVLVFCTQEDADPHKLLNVFRRYWCMARPQCLFLALPGELRVYSLNQDPAKNVETWQNIKPLDVVRKATDVAQILQAYRREQVETGQLFQEKRFGDIEQRADKRLIQDLKLVRQALLDTGLKPRYAHALIGRSIFIRYLEDREILTSTYFEGVAAQNPQWQDLLSNNYLKPDASPTSHERWYDRVLQNKMFTYAFFQQLALDFNGDMFPRDQEEEDAVDQSHLDLLSKFLLGDVDPHQPALFLWAYDFEIIPTDLISSIYEEFYHANNEDDKGTHYTPSVLVEYVLSETLSNDCLAQNPRILDPACGSGIFLVEAFRRIVRYKVQQSGKQLNSGELRQILREQIAGIEINSEAVHVAAFSLYLALLHYQEPPDIRQNPRLPNLIFRGEPVNDIYDFGILFNINTFNPTAAEREILNNKLDKQPKFKGRTNIQKFLKISEHLPVTEHSFDIIVGNPPWGSSKGVSTETQKGWCESFGWSIGDIEPSQAFIARVLPLMKSSGTCGFLVSTGVFLKHQKNSEEFRRRWLDQCTLKTVVNFAHVRHVFFSADSPFAFIQFDTEKPLSGHRIKYWSAKRTDMVDRLQVIVLSLPDLKQIAQTELQNSSYLWKTYWWGSHRDAALINTLSLNPSLGELLEIHGWGTPYRGFQGPRKTAKNYPSGWLTEFNELPGDDFRRYGPIDPNKLVVVPEEVHRKGAREIYEGWRILVKRTQNDGDNTNGVIVARLEAVPYSVRNTIHGFSVTTASDWERKVLIGILWSSIARYFLFMVSSGWGIYHYEIHLDELMLLPIRFPENLSLRNRIIKIVDKLLSWNYDEPDTLFRSKSNPELAPLEQQLDEAIFELYGLSQSERNLIEDMCSVGFELLYRKTSKKATSRVDFALQKSHGTLSDLTKTLSNDIALQNYLMTFLQIWNRELEPGGEFSWRVIRPANVPMIAVIFTTQEKGQIVPQENLDDTFDWHEVLQRCAKVLQQPVSRRIYIDGMIRVVTDTQIYIIKKDERRLWTNSMAREDADATRLQAIHLQQPEAL